MKHLIIYAHPNMASFNYAIKEALVETLRLAGNDVRVRDLYALKFNSSLDVADFEGITRGKPPADVAEEQKHILWADQINFIYPLWWDRAPAIAEGYIDRVLVKGFAYDYTEQGAIGLLKGKRVAAFTTCGAPLSVLESSGVKQMGNIFDRDIFGFCGMEVVLHRYFGSVPTVTHEERVAMLSEVKKTAMAWKDN